jgi:hypothetical protein
MSFRLQLVLLSALALPVAACSHQSHAASRTPDQTLRNGTPDGDHTGSDPSNPRSDIDDHAPAEQGSGPEGVPAPGGSSPGAGPSSPSGVAPAGPAGPGR